MMQYEDANKFGKEFMDTSLKSIAAFSKGAQAIAVEATEYTKQSFENGASTLEKLMGSKSLEKAIEIQTEYARQTYEGLVNETTRMGELYADMARDVYKPFENVLSRGK
jgi:hypothetical protein